MSNFEIYDKSKQFSDLPNFIIDNRINDPELYQPSQKLIDAVNVALSLGQPLLLTGEPGTGKTQLAYHLAHYFQLKQPIVFNVKTTSSANDLFYKYDALKHFQYNQVNTDSLSNEQIEDNFIEYQALGKAINIAVKQKKRSIVLIDEIDKAPRDLPNDILGAIERLEFEVPEVNKIGDLKITTDHEYRPIIILTSNSEKSLPDAFLRRCVFFHIEYPTREELKNIIHKKIHNLNNSELDCITIHFEKIRGICQNKKPATAELLMWISYLQKREFIIGKLGGSSPLTSIDKEILKSSYSILSKSKEDLKTLWQTV